VKAYILWSIKSSRAPDDRLLLLEKNHQHHQTLPQISTSLPSSASSLVLENHLYPTLNMQLSLIAVVLQAAAVMAGRRPPPSKSQNAQIQCGEGSGPYCCTSDGSLVSPEYTCTGLSDTCNQIIICCNQNVAEGVSLILIFISTALGQRLIRMSWQSKGSQNCSGLTGNVKFV
jgi:hypothetical protein